MTFDRALLDHKQAAARMGVSHGALHYLVDRGVIEPHSVTARGGKLYDPADLEGLTLRFEEIEKLVLQKKAARKPRGDNHAQQQQATAR